MRTWHIYRYFFAWQRTMAWITLTGVVLLGVGHAPVPAPFDRVLVAFGSILAGIFPVILAGVPYRALISNRHCLLLPWLRLHAASALLAMAVTASLVAVVFANTVLASHAPNLAVVAAYAFIVVSTYLLLSQWLITYVGGFLALFLVPFLAFRLVSPTASMLRLGVPDVWPLLALTALGWLWLWLTTRSARPPRPMALAGMGEVQQADTSQGNYQWLPQFGPAASAAGTLLRGARDGLGNRLLMTLMAMLTFPLGLWGVMLLIGMPFNGPGDLSSTWPVFLLAWSFFGMTLHIAIWYGEWPARLRVLWLRRAGNRAQGWRLLERSLWQDALLIAGCSTMLSLLVQLLGTLAVKYLAFYVAGCLSMALFVSYCTFWIRAAGTRRIVLMLLILLVVFVCCAVLTIVTNSSRPNGIFWLLPAIALLTLAARTLAHRRCLRIDWCAIRPARPARRAV